MKKIKIGLLLGVVAGVIDVIPMILQNLDWYSNMSAFFFWVAMGIVIPNVKLGLRGNSSRIISITSFYISI